MMKSIILILGLLFSFTLKAQEPQANFFKLIKWGDGASTNITLKLYEHISRFIPLEDGYLIEYNAVSTSNKSMMRYTRLDFDFNKVWSLEFDGTDSVGNDAVQIYTTNEETQNDIIIDGKLYSFSGCAINAVLGMGHEDGQIFNIIDMNTGELLYSKLLWNGADALYQRRSFYPYQDSLFSFSGWEYLELPLYPKIHIMDRLGNVVKEMYIPDLNNGSVKIIKVEPKLGGFDILFKEDMHDETISTYRLYSGTLDSTGHLVAVDTVGYLKEPIALTLTYREGVEVHLDNGHRFVAAQLDTTPRDIETWISDIYATFDLDSNGIVLEDSLYNLTPDPIFPINQGYIQDTAYNIGNICKLSTGEVVVVGSMETFNQTYDDCLLLFVVKYDASGEFLWRKHYNPFDITGSFNLNRIWVSQVHEDKDGGILIGGKISYLFDTIGYPDGYDASGYLLKLDKDGCYNGDCDGGLLLDADDPLISSGLDFQVFPNPVSDVLNIEVPNMPSYELKIMTSDGKIQYVEKAIREKNKEIETRYWPQGIYFIWLKSNNKMAIKMVNVVH